MQLTQSTNSKLISCRPLTRPALSSNSLFYKTIVMPSSPTNSSTITTPVRAPSTSTSLLPLPLMKLSRKSRIATCLQEVELERPHLREELITTQELCPHK
jgi:hypothetical protein